MMSRHSRLHTLSAVDEYQCGGESPIIYCSDSKRTVKTVKKGQSKAITDNQHITALLETRDIPLN